MINELFKNRSALNIFIQELKKNSDATNVFRKVFIDEIGLPITLSENDDLPF